MRNLEAFQQELAVLIGTPTELRPFVCDGSPLECEVFIVGFNPATSMLVDFWQFWCPSKGFDKESWLEAYKKDRQVRPLKPGKTRRNAVSPTRRVMEWVLEGAAPYKCLETNIYSASTEQAVDLASERRITAPFDFLLANIKPRIIVAHGVGAVEHIQKMNIDAKVFSVSHFSRGWSREAALELGVKIKDELGIGNSALS